MESCNPPMSAPTLDHNSHLIYIVWLTESKYECRHTRNQYIHEVLKCMQKIYFTLVAKTVNRVSGSISEALSSLEERESVSYGRNHQEGGSERFVRSQKYLQRSSGISFQAENHNSMFTCDLDYAMFRRVCLSIAKMRRLRW